MKTIVIFAASFFLLQALMNAGEKPYRTPPAEVVVKGDLLDTQRIYTAIHDLLPTPTLYVEVQPRKGRKELIVGELTQREIAALLAAEQDPFAALVKGNVQGVELVNQVALWDMRNDPKIIERWQSAGSVGQLLRIPAEFYGLPKETPLHEVYDAIGWKQLERRGVKIVIPKK